MRPTFVLITLLFALLMAAYLLLMPASGHFVRYLWWRTTAAQPVPGSVLSGDARIHYSRFGQGPALLLLHGGLSNRLSWFSQIPCLVQAGRQVIVVDTRGHGRSELGGRELSYRQFADDAVRVLDELGLAHTDVVGWSDGGNIGLLLGRYHPERINRIVAISANYDPSGLTPEAHADATTPSQGMRYWLRRWWTHAGEHTGELEQRIKRLWRTAPHLTADDLRAIPTPTLIIVGRNDVVSVDHAEEMAGLLPNSRLLILPDGHALPITHPDEINRAIGGFLFAPE